MGLGTIAHMRRSLSNNSPLSSLCIQAFTRSRASFIKRSHCLWGLSTWNATISRCYSHGDPLNATQECTHCKQGKTLSDVLCEAKPLHTALTTCVLQHSPSFSTFGGSAALLKRYIAVTSSLPMAEIRMAHPDPIRRYVIAPAKLPAMSESRKASLRFLLRL